MLERIGEMHGREVISVLDGSRIGYLGDIEFDTQQAALTAIVVYGRPRFFGLFGRENDPMERCEDHWGGCGAGRSHSRKADTEAQFLTKFL